MTNITILGSGFAALTAVRHLRKTGVQAEIRLISPRDHLHYLPSIIWLPPHLRTPEALKVPLTAFFARHQVEYVPDMVTGVAEQGRVVKTATAEFRNDHLIIATGGRFLRKLPGIEHALIPCEGVDVGAEISRRLDAMTGGRIAIGFGANPKEPGAVRGGPMFEFLFILDTWLRQQGKRENFELIFFSGADRPGQRLGERAVDGMLSEMRRRNIILHLGHKPVRFDADKVVTEAEEFPADMILFMPGITGPSWLEHSNLPLSDGGMIKADRKCRADGMVNVWVAGDAGSFPGPGWMPKQAHQADLQAKAVAHNIRDVLLGGTAETEFKPELICIVDTLDAGMVVYRSEQMNFTLPRLMPFHALKVLFEKLYLRQYA